MHCANVSFRILSAAVVLCTFAECDSRTAAAEPRTAPVNQKGGEGASLGRMRQLQVEHVTLVYAPESEGTARALAEYAARCNQRLTQWFQPAAPVEQRVYWMARKDWRNKPDTYGFPYANGSDAYLPASDLDLPTQLTYIADSMAIPEGGPAVDRMIRLLQLPEGAGPKELYTALKQSRDFFLVFTAYFILPHELTHGYCNHLNYPQQPRWCYEGIAQWAAYKIQGQLRSPREADMIDQYYQLLWERATGLKVRDFARADELGAGGLDTPNYAWYHAGLLRMFRQLEEMKGGELLPGLLRTIGRRHRGVRNVPHVEMIRTFSEVVGRDLRPWFKEKWNLDGAESFITAAASPKATSPLAGITATMEGDSVVRVVSAGLFETTVTRRKGFGGSFWDLKHDADKKFDLGPVLDENGILWTKCGFPNELEKSDGSWYAAPCERLELLESGPARVRVRTSGPHCRYGSTDVKARWNELGFEQTFTMYPSGATYIDYCLVAERPLRLHHFLLIIKSNGSWGNRGKGEGKGEVHCASESGDTVEYGKGSCLALQWSDGPTHFQDFLMVLHTGKFGGTYWNEGYEDKDIRTGLNLVSRWPGGQLPAGRDHILLLFCFGQNFNSPEAAQQCAEDYHKPDTLTVTQGAVVTNDAGDFDSDGFNEVEGCYVLRATPRGVEFTLHGAKTPRESPVFKVKDWAGTAPTTVTLGTETLTPGEGFVAAIEAGQLIVQVQRRVMKDVPIAIPAKTRLNAIRLP